MQLSQAVYEAYRHTTKEYNRFDLDTIRFTTEEVAATDGTTLYLAQVDNVPFEGLIRRTPCAPAPRKNLAKNGYTYTDGNLDILGTRFRGVGDAKFPPVEKVESSPGHEIAVDAKSFKFAISNFYKIGTEARREAQIHSETRVNVEYVAELCIKDEVMYIKCRYGLDDIEGTAPERVNLGAAKGVKNSGVRFNPKRYKLAEGPTSISFDARSIVFSLPGRKVILCALRED